MEDDGNRKHFTATVKMETNLWGDDNGVDEDIITDMIDQL